MASISAGFLLSLFVSSLFLSSASSAGNFKKDVYLSWGEERAKILDGGKRVTLSLDEWSGSGFESKNQYMFGRVDMDLKLVPGNSAGTVTAYFLSSQGAEHDEIDFEFLGNETGEPYTVHTNVFTKGHGGREQQFSMWFDPTEDFHTYSIMWNPLRIIFMVDEIPIRVYENLEASGVPFPSKQPMKLYSSIWNADSWATQGGKVKIDWKKAPFKASYKNLRVAACLWPSRSSSCSTSTSISGMNQELDVKAVRKLQWVQKYYMVYNYCTDYQRFIYGVPFECTHDVSTSQRS